MSAIGDKDLVRVRSHDELRVGMTLVDKGADQGPVIILRISVQGILHDSGTPCTTELGFVDTVSSGPDDHVCYCEAIADRALYRLRDLEDSAEDDEVVAKPTALERTR